MNRVCSCLWQSSWLHLHPEFVAKFDRLRNTKGSRRRDTITSEQADLPGKKSLTIHTWFDLLLTPITRGDRDPHAQYIGDTAGILYQHPTLDWGLAETPDWRTGINKVRPDDQVPATAPVGQLVIRFLSGKGIIFDEMATLISTGCYVQ